MQEALAMVVDEELVTMVDNSFCFSLMIDESTDIATMQTLIVYIRLVSKGEIITNFLELVKLPGGKADEIPGTLLDVMTSRNLPLEKLFGLATDGASVMTGVRSGVTTRMKGRNPFIISTHCIAHRLALASGKAADTVQYFKKYQQYMNTIYKYFHYSPKHSNTLKRVQEILECAERKFQQVFHTRWLSFDGAVHAILTNIEALISALISDSTTDTTAKWILTFITTFEFLASTHLLYDVLPILTRLSKTFQRQCVDFSVITDAVQAAVGAIKHAHGPQLAGFLSNVPDTPAEFFYFKEQRISDGAVQREHFEKSKIYFLDALVANLNSCFPATDSTLLSSFSVPDPQILPGEAELPIYGNTELDTLCERYGSAKVTSDGCELPAAIDSDEVKDEWIMFKQLISKNFRSCTIQTLYRQLLNSQDLSLQYPNIAKLLTIVLTLPVSTVDCERGFSRHNLIKTRLRSRLLTKNVSTLMEIAIDTPDIQHMNNFSFHRVFIIWCSQKDCLIANS